MDNALNKALIIKDLSVSFKSGQRIIEAVKNVSLELNKGETLALVGESGSGKSVTALSILRLLPYPNAFHPSGEIIYQNQDLMQAKESQMHNVRGNQISMIFQEPLMALNPLHIVEKQICESLYLHQKLDNDSARKKALELLHLVGIRDPEQKSKAYPHQLSGGQRQRVMIAMALANEPDILIADEPTTALDVTIQAQILELLADLQKRYGMTILLITHDLGIVRKVADRVAVMKDGKLIERGETEEIFTQPKHAYTQELIDAEPEGQPDPVDENAVEVINAQNVKVWFPIKKGILKRTVDHVKAVNDVSLSIKQGQTIGVVGESGSGKTTLALALLRLLPSEGNIVFMGQNINSYSSKELQTLRQDMQIVFQDPYGSLNPRFTIAQIIEEGLITHRKEIDESTRLQMIRDVLTEVEINPEVMHRYPHEFSGGQRQRIAIARALILEPDFIVLDEPTSALDRSVQAQVIDLLRSLQSKHNLAYLFISHDLKVVRALSHKIIVLRNGEAVETGTTEQIFDQPKESYTQALIKAAFDIKSDSVINV